MESGVTSHLPVRLNSRLRTAGVLLVVGLIIEILSLFWIHPLAFVGFLGVAALAGLHGVNALAMVGLGIYLVKSNWAFGRPTPAQAPPTSNPTR